MKRALKQSLKEINLIVKEFTVAPNITPTKGLLHEWWVEFEEDPSEKESIKLCKKIDEKLQEQNTYYKDLIQGKVLKHLELVLVKKGGFKKYMDGEGKLGGQNKLPRLSNDRKMCGRPKKIH